MHCIPYDDAFECFERNRQLIIIMSFSAHCQDNWHGQKLADHHTRCHQTRQQAAIRSRRTLPDQRPETA